MKPFKATYQREEPEIVLVIDFSRDKHGIPVVIFVHNNGEGELDWDELDYFTHCQLPWN